MGSTLRVTGMPWLGVDEALETSVASLTAKMLCSRHNETLGPLDQEAALIFGKLRLALTELEIRRRCDLQMRDVPFFLQDFTDRYEGRYRDVQLPLPMRLV